MFYFAKLYCFHFLNARLAEPPLQFETTLSLLPITSTQQIWQNLYLDFQREMCLDFILGCVADRLLWSRQFLIFYTLACVCTPGVPNLLDDKIGAGQCHLGGRYLSTRIPKRRRWQNLNAWLSAYFVQMREACPGKYSSFLTLLKGRGRGFQTHVRKFTQRRERTTA